MEAAAAEEQQGAQQSLPPPPPPLPPLPQPPTRRPGRSRRPLSRGSLESTLEELDEVIRGIDEAAGGAWEPEPENPLRRPYWLLRLIRATVRDGGFLTPRLHVPALVWQMDGASFAGLAAKSKALEAVLILLVDRVLPLEKPRGPGDIARARMAQRAFASVRAELDELQNQLARPFPFIPEIKGSSREEAAAAVADGNGNGGSGLNQVQQRLSSLFSKTVKTVKKSAVSAYTAYERIGVTVASKISDEELLAYASLVHEVCNKAQCLDAWFAHLDGLRKALQEQLRGAGFVGGVDESIKAFHRVAEETLVELLHCARFLQEVVVELLMRDISSLLETYLRKMRKSFARMIFEMEDEDD